MTSGLYTILFGICIYVLLPKRNQTVQLIIMAAVVVMYAIATADVAVSVYLIFRHVLAGDGNIGERDVLPKVLFYVTNT